jgi:hypothetical protein
MTSSSSSAFLLLLALMCLLANNLGINANPDEKFAECCHKITGLPADVAAIGKPCFKIYVFISSLFFFQKSVQISTWLIVSCAATCSGQSVSRIYWLLCGT